jgi:TonB dependent receptor
MKAPISMGNGPSMLAMYGITGLPTSPSLVGGLTDQDISGFESFGRDSQSPQWQNPLVYNPKVNYSKIIGRHTLKAGYEYQAIVTELNDFNPSYGQDNYSGQFSNPTPTKSNTLYNWADFLVGARSSYQLTNYTEARLEQRMNMAYFQDDFRVSSKLTLNLGVRYEFATPQWERNNNQANYDPATNSLVYAQNGSIADRALVNPQYKDWAPRVGLAYSINPKTVIRTGYGISYVLFIRQGGDSYLADNGPSVVNANVSQQPSEGLCASADQNTNNCFLPTQMGYPIGITSPANFSTVNTKTVYIDPTIRWPYVQNWDFTIQRELTKDMMLDVGYVGNHSVGDWVNEDLNQALPNQPGQSLPLAARRPDQEFAYIDSNLSAGFSTYEALQVKLEKRFSHGFTFLNSFTWSHAIDNAAGALEMGNGDFQAINKFDSQAQKGNSGYNQPLNDTFSVVYNIPFGRGLRYGSNMPRWLDAVAGGWIVSGINSMLSGEPINLTYDPSSAFVATDGTKNSAVYTPNLVGPTIYPAAGQQTIKNYFKTNNIQVPTDVSHPYGNAGRNIGTSNAIFNLDSGVHKQFPLWNESSKLEFRGEFFNTLNQTIFSPASGDRSSSSFGTITSTFPARQVQFALRLLF